MLWATDDYSPDNAEEWYRKAAVKFINREELVYLIFLKDESQYLGNVSAFKFNWEIAKYEIGYWLRTSHHGQGFMTEAVGALMDAMKQIVPVKRVEIRMESRNQKSRAVPERLGFQLEGILRNQCLAPDKSVRDTCVYARVNS